MVRLKRQISINISPKANESRVTFSQRSWAVLALAAGIFGAIAGAPIWLCALCVVVLVLPILIQIMRQRGVLGEGTSGDELLIFAWTLVALVSMALGGGALSPLTAMLLVGPLGALAIGRTGLGLEIAALGLFAYALAIVAGLLGWAALAPASWSGLIGPLAVAAMIQIVVLVWACAPTAQKVGPEGALVVPADIAAEAVRAGDGAVMKLSLPILLVDIAKEGRVRRIEGPDALRWEGLVVGKVADAALANLEAGYWVSPNGQRFLAIEERHAEGGRWIGLLPDDVVGPQESAGPEDLAAITAQLEDAKAALSDRTAFFAGLGHDLKTPLNAILGFADLMKAQVRGPLPDAYKDYPAIIHESGQDLMLLVDDILDLAKAEASSHRLDLEPVDLVASAASVVRQLQDQAARAEVRLSLDEETEVWAEADARAVRQIWQNLVSNAIKYSNKKGVVTLSAGKAAGAVAISVKDRGAGMDENDLERVAKPFAQGDNAKGRAGTGLGLAVVQRFAELHGGKVIIDTELGKGTQVRVTLPAADMSSLSDMDDAAQ